MVFTLPFFESRILPKMGACVPSKVDVFWGLSHNCTNCQPLHAWPKFQNHPTLALKTEVLYSSLAFGNFTKLYVEITKFNRWFIQFISRFGSQTVGHDQRVTNQLDSIAWPFCDATRGQILRPREGDPESSSVAEVGGPFRLVADLHNGPKKKSCLCRSTFEHSKGYCRFNPLQCLHPMMADGWFFGSCREPEILIWKKQNVW